MSMQCKVDIPAVSGSDDNVLTVGREFYLSCNGDWPKNLNLEKIQFADENLKYELKLLHFEFRTPQEADLQVTSYLAGQHQWPNVVVTDGSQSVELGPVAFQVQSVLPKGKEKIEPYGPMGPALIPIPLVYWLILLAAILLLVASGSMRWYRHSQRRKMLERLKEHDSALSPLQQFHQSMRKLQRASPVFYGQNASAEELRQGSEELFRMFKMYLSRRLLVPAFEWNERLILRDLRSYQPAVFQEHGRKIKELYTEFKKAQTSTSLQAGDVVQMSQSLRKLLEGIDRVLENSRGGSR